MIRLTEPHWELTYANRDITAEITPWVLEVKYTDNLHGEADELELTLENGDGRFWGAWAPTRKDRLGLRFGYRDEPLQDAGGFEIDELEFKGAPHTLALKALAAGVAPALRTKRSQGYEGRSLRSVAEEIAGRHGMQVVGDIDAVMLDRLTQADTPDLSFLKKQAEDFGYFFSIKDRKMVFQPIDVLKRTPSVLLLQRKDLLDYQIKRGSVAKVKGAKISYHDPATGSVVEAEATDAGSPVSGDILRLHTRAPDLATAQRRAAAGLERANRGKDGEGTLTVIGDQRIAAGVRVELSGFGSLDQTYLVERAIHAMTRDAAYTTQIEVKAG